MSDAGRIATSQTLAAQALENLVNQFARPLDFLRELVQNSIDAGSPRVEVWLSYAAPRKGALEGVVEIHVDDFGDGMDEHLIDSQLTKMFSSTKEDDLTKIGKFGIGFTSIFAIRPDAVLLRTGKHGESWELLFHEDRSFDKVRLDVPVAGTQITLFKHMLPTEVDRFVRECRWVLRHWCEHSDTPITFADRTGEREPDTPEPADPFAAFADPGAGGGPGTETTAAGPERISGPMALPGPFTVAVRRAGVEALLGFTDTPRYGFYNGGLTLLSTRSRDALGHHADRLGHLTFKVKSDKLEHTLTRDNVLQDEHWQVAMEVLVEAAETLQARVLGHLSEVEPNDPDALDPILDWLAAECRASDLKERPDFSAQVRLPTVGGAPVTLAEVEAQEDELGAVLLEDRSGTLRAALAREGYHLLPDRPALRRFLEAAVRPQPFLSFTPRGSFVRQRVPADARFVVPELLDEATLPPIERALVDEVAAALSTATRGRVRVRVGAFGGAGPGASEALALEGPEEGGLFQRPRPSWFRLPAFLRSRCLLVNRHHPAYRAQVVAAAEDPLLAGFALSQAILHVAGTAGEAAWSRLNRAATERLLDGSEP